MKLELSNTLSSGYRFDVRVIKHWFSPDEEIVVLQVGYKKWSSYHRRLVTCWRDASMSDFRAISL